MSYLLGSVSIAKVNLVTGTQDSSTYNNVLTDQAIKIQGTQAITSYWNQAGNPTPIDAKTALERSSNTYFVQLGMKIGGQNTWSEAH